MNTLTFLFLFAALGAAFATLVSLSYASKHEDDTDSEAIAMSDWIKAMVAVFGAASGIFVLSASLTCTAKVPDRTAAPKATVTAEASTLRNTQRSRHNSRYGYYLVIANRHVQCSFFVDRIDVNEKTGVVRYNGYSSAPTARQKNGLHSRPARVAVFVTNGTVIVRYTNGNASGVDTYTGGASVRRSISPAEKLR